MKFRNVNYSEKKNHVKRGGEGERGRLYQNKGT